MWCSYVSIDVNDDDSEHLKNVPLLGWIHNREKDPDANPDCWHTVGGTPVTRLAGSKGGSFVWYADKDGVPQETIRAVIRLDQPDADF
jgi:hypothetical protein